MTSLLDFSRNEIFAPVAPNSSMVLIICIVTQSNSPKEFAAYFLKHHIQYVLYSYGDQASFENKGTILGEIKKIAIGKFYQNRFSDFQAVLMEMKSHYQTIYDDGFTFVLDLNQPIQK